MKRALGIVRLLCVSLLLLVLSPFSPASAEPRRVLLLHSFGRENSPFDAFAITSRTRWGETVESRAAVMNRPRVLLADDHPGVAKALSDILSSEFDLVGVVGDG